MWRTFLDDTPFYRKFVDFTPARGIEVGLYTDAAGAQHLGFGCYCRGRWMAEVWPEGLFSQRDTPPSIAFLELFAVVLAVAQWSHE